MAREYLPLDMTVAQLREAIDYDHSTGKFYWRRRKNVPHQINVQFAGIEAGYYCAQLGYVLIGLENRLYRAHRLAWFYVFGVWPPSDIDHIDGDGYNNRIANLRLCTRSQNNANMRKPKHNTSGLKGAFWDKRAGRWLSKIVVQRKPHYLGYYDTAEAAHAAYCEAAKRLHGAFARTE